LVYQIINLVYRVTDAVILVPTRNPHKQVLTAVQ